MSAPNTLLLLNFSRGSWDDSLGPSQANPSSVFLFPLYRYDDLGGTSAAPNDPPHAAIPTTSLVSAADPTLTAYAQLGAHRLDADRALISLFDRERQHVVAEATRTSPLAAGEHHAIRSDDVDVNVNVPGGLAGAEQQDKNEVEDGFWLCGTAIPRSFGICEHVLLSSDPGRRGHAVPASSDTLTPGPAPPTPGHAHAPPTADLPVFVVPDLAADPRFHDRPYIHDRPSLRFYAGVPIRTPGPDGVNIGVYCIFDTRPRPQGLTADEAKFLRDMARTAMGYLECRASSARYRGSERMVKGMGNFVEGLDALAPARGAAVSRSASGHVKRRSSRLVDLAEVASGGGGGDGDGGGRNNNNRAGAMPVRLKKPELPSKSLGSAPRILDDSLLSPRTSSTPLSARDWTDGSKGSPLLEPSAAATLRHPISIVPSSFAPPFAPDDSSRSSTPRPESQQSGDSSPRPAVLAQVSTADLQRVEAARVFAKAANIIRQSLDVDGVLFLDATVRSFGGLVGQSERKVSSVGIENLSYLSNDEDAASQSQHSAANREDYCNVLGYATPQSSSIRGDRAPWQFQGMRDRTLQRLLRRYPHGRIFNFEADGTALQPCPAHADRDPPTPGIPPRRPASPTRQWSRESQDAEVSGVETIPTLQRRNAAADSIIRLFPGARSVIIIPLWDAQKKRWVAGGFLWTNSPTRIFTTDGTMSFLKVFGLVVMADIYKISLKAEETMKSNILGSISHELRSPLHGLVGAVELLHDSKLDAVQHNVLNIIETSGKTLVDTINHLLDYSKINSFIENDKKDTFLGKVGAEAKERRFENQSSQSGVTAELDCLVEEVVESVLAGFSHERLSGPRATRDVMEYRKYSDSFANPPAAPAVQGGGDRVQIYLDIEPGMSWRFHTHPGAFRRIVMNLFGNSLKFTRSGFIKISLTQEPAKPYQQNSRASVLLTVADSGKGISEDYLRNSLFTPFCQEDHFAPGTGLGLSLVRQIAVNIGGEVKVVSQVGRGTTITVSLPLPCAEEPPEGVDLTGSMKDIRQLKGRKVLLRGFEGAPTTPAEDREPSTLQQGATEDVGKLLESQAHLLQSTCRDWLHMQVLSEAEAAQDQPDFIVHHDSTLSFEAAEAIAAAAAPCPVLFVCEATVAVRNFSWNLPDAESRMRTFEFFSLPLGPRKLAKGLVHLLNMCKVMQERSEPASHAASVQASPTARDDRAVVMADASSSLAASHEVGFGITLIKSPGTRSAPMQTALEVKATPLPTPPEDQVEPIPPVVTKTVEGPYVLIADDNAINLKVSF